MSEHFSEHARSSLAFHGLARDVSEQHFCHTLSIEAVISPPTFNAEPATSCEVGGQRIYDHGLEPPPQRGGRQEQLLSSSQEKASCLATVLFLLS